MGSGNLLTSGQIETAVNWWADAIGGEPRHENLRPAERMAALRNEPGSGGFGTAVAASMARDSARHHRPTSEAMERFKVELRSALAKETESGCSLLNVDYGPNELLGKAADAAGIDDSVFPWKTHMWFDGGGVRVRCGYGAETVDLPVG